MFRQIALRISDAIAHPFALFVCVAFCVVGWRFLGLDQTLLWVSFVALWLLFPLQASVKRSQDAQDRHTLAIQAKLDTVIAALDKADDRLIGIEKDVEGCDDA